MYRHLLYERKRLEKSRNCIYFLIQNRRDMKRTMSCTCSHLVLLLSGRFQITLFQPLCKTQATILQRPTLTSKLQVFLKIKCHINCSIYVCLNHLTCNKLWYFVLGSYHLYVSLRKTLRSVTLHSERPCLRFFCTVIFRNTYVML